MLGTAKATEANLKEMHAEDMHKGTQIYKELQFMTSQLSKIVLTFL